MPDLPGLPPSDRRESPTCVTRGSLTRYGRLADLPLVYEVSRRRSEFSLEPGFAGQLEAWLADLVRLTSWRGRQLWTYGTWTDGGSACSSWHDAGRAFDLARLRLADDAEVSCRYDQWRDRTGNALVEARRGYWVVAASLHKHFAYVLTYLYNAQHHNHIHVDNGRSGSAMSTFNGRSPAQIQAVQGICRHLWDQPVEPTGRWDRPTREAVATIVEALPADGGEPHQVITDQPTWTAFLDASVRRGSQPL